MLFHASKRKIIIILVTAALFAAVIFGAKAGILFPPHYSAPEKDKILEDDSGHKVVMEGRRIRVSRNRQDIWELPSGVLAQDFLIGDIDHDGNEDLLILCWKRGRYGRQRPTWVKHDEISWSQHIYIYDIKEEKVVPKWMASDIGVCAVHIEYDGDVLHITDTEGLITRWKWIKWGFEKM